jgi:hypothetical protein
MAQYINKWAQVAMLSIGRIRYGVFHGSYTH